MVIDNDVIGSSTEKKTSSDRSLARLGENRGIVLDSERESLTFLRIGDTRFSPPKYRDLHGVLWHYLAGGHNAQ